MGAPIFAAVAYGAASAVALALFAWDKAAAARGAERVSERTLHLVELLGGWPGALLAAALFRHKVRKASYLAVTALIALLHLGAWWWFAGGR